jgi:peptidyl-prolyl cis-trans isomerase D
MGDPAIAEAAFALPVNEVSQPVKGTLVTALLKVSKIETGSTANYESVAADIKRAMASDRARAAMQDLRNKIEDERGGGANIAEAAQKLGLKALVIDAVDRSGRAPDGTPVSGLPQGVDIISAAFASDVGVENETMQINGGEVWFDVLGITPSRERSLEEVKGLVETRWRGEQMATRLRAKATALVEKLNAGTAFTDAASADGLKIEKSVPFKRNATLNGLPPKAVETAFRTAKDNAALAEGTEASDWFVFKVVEVMAPPVDAASEDAKKLSETVQRAMGEELIAQYVAQLQTDLGVSVNDSALAIATGAASSQ